MKKLFAVLASIVTALPCFALDDNGYELLITNRELRANLGVTNPKLWGPWNGRSDLRLLANEAFNECGSKQLSDSMVALAQKGVKCFEREFARYFPSYKTSRTIKKADDGSAHTVIIVGQISAEPAKKINQTAQMVFSVVGPECGQIARGLDEESWITEGSTKQSNENSPAAVRSYNCYVRLLGAF